MIFNKLTAMRKSPSPQNCDNGCYEVGLILFDRNNEHDFYDIERKNKKKLSKYDAYNAIADGSTYGFIKYGLASYCVDIGHADCLRKLHENTDMLWHSDLADCAIEKDNLECLKLIIEVIGDVDICSDNIGKNCEEYIKNLDCKKLLEKKVTLNRCNKNN